MLFDTKLNWKWKKSWENTCSIQKLVNFEHKQFLEKCNLLTECFLARYQVVRCKQFLTENLLLWGILWCGESRDERQNQVLCSRFFRRVHQINVSLLSFYYRFFTGTENWYFKYANDNYFHRTVTSRFLSFFILCFTSPVSHR